METEQETVDRLCYEAFKKEGETREEYELRKWEAPF